MFLDDTACNLASLNLVKFYDDDTGRFDIETYEHAIRIWTIVLEISVTMAHFPAKPIAQGSYDVRRDGECPRTVPEVVGERGVDAASDP